MNFVQKKSSNGCVNTSVAEVVSLNTKMDIETFLERMEDPFIPNLKEAAELIKKFIDDYRSVHGQKMNVPITIVGDYDSDGINATAIMYWGLVTYGVTPATRVPRRFSEGYGLSEKIIDEIHNGLVITVDNGISAYSAIEKAKKKGLSVVVTDHHLAPVDDNGQFIIPPADVVVDPHVTGAEFSDYCGAAIAYRLVKELNPTKKLSALLVLASIATVSDVMPLVGANRTLVQDGLKLINRNAPMVPPGLEALLNELKIEVVTEGDYGFSIGPIYNAAGRLYDNGADKVLRLLLGKRGDPRLSLRASMLVEINQQRKDLVKESMAIAEELMTKNPVVPIVLYHETFGEGIIGIIAGQLCEKHNCPVIVFTRSKEKGVLKGSGRSIPGYPLKSILDQIHEHILRYGGHAGAAGLSIEEGKLKDFTEAFVAAVGTLPDHGDTVLYDLELNRLLIPAVIEDVKRFAPYGEGNPQVRFRMRYDGTNGKYSVIGDGTHFMIKDGDLTIVRLI